MIFVIIVFVQFMTSLCANPLARSLGQVKLVKQVKIMKEFV